MIRALKAFVEWLDRRFPPRLVVSEVEFRAMSTVQKEHHLRYLQLEEKVDAMEKTISALKEVLTKGIMPGVVKEQRRAEFIANGRMAE